MEKVKFEDLSFDKGKLKLEELAALEGGQLIALSDGCSSGICNDNRDVGSKYCEGSAVCTSGIGPCTGKT